MSQSRVDLAAAALDAAARVSVSTGIESNSNSIANQDIEWYNKGVGLIEDKKYREALSCFDRALPSFADDDEMVIRILNGRGNALYYLEDYPKCVESYHKAMVINPKGVQGKTLYNMGKFTLRCRDLVMRLNASSKQYLEDWTKTNKNLQRTNQTL